MSNDDKWSQIQQTQLFIQTVIDARINDKKEFESRINDYLSQISKIRNMILSSIIFITTVIIPIFNTYQELQIFVIPIIFINIIFAVIIYFTIEYIHYTIRKSTQMAKIAYGLPIARMMILREYILELSIQDINEIYKDNLANLFQYIKLIGMTRFEIIPELKKLQKIKWLKADKNYYEHRYKTEEMQKIQLIEFYGTCKHLFQSDGLVKMIDKQLGTINGKNSFISIYDKMDISEKIEEYNNTKMQISLQIPKHWHLEEFQETTQSGNSIILGPKIFFDVTITIEKLKLNTFKNLNDFIEDIKERKDKKIIEESEISIQDYICYKMIYESEFNNTLEKIMEIYIQSDNNLYKISYKAFKQNFDRFFPTIKKIYDSFRITN